MPETTLEEDFLVERAIAGEGDAFGELYRRHIGSIYRYIYPRVGNASDAEDLTEQVFLNAWKALPTYEQRGHRFVSWLYRIAHNEVASYHRKHKPDVVPLSWVEQNGSDDRKTSLERIIETEEIYALNAAINQLPHEHQQVINLRFVEGLNHAEVGRVIDKSEGASRTIQYRALATLNHLLNNSVAKAAGLVLACVAWLLIGGGGIVYGAAQSLPGNTLYPLKRGAEMLQIATAFDTIDRAALHLLFAERRLDEAARLIQKNRFNDVNQALNNYENQLQAAVLLLYTQENLTTGQRAILTELVVAAQAEHETQLADLLAGSPETAGAVIESALEFSRAGRDAALQAKDRESNNEETNPPPTRLPAILPELASPPPLPALTATLTSTAAPLPASAPTSTPTPSPTSTATPVPTFTPSPTATPTFTPSPTASPTFTPSPTATPTFTPRPTAIPTFTPSSQPISTPIPPTNVPAPTPSPDPREGWYWPEEWPWPETPDDWPDHWPWLQKPPGWPDHWPWPETPDDWPDFLPWPDAPDHWP